jgi:ATP-dependent Clp protease ATP-binding subunit ClpC
MHGYNFSERCRRTLALAREVAAKLGHQYVNADHLLLAIIEEREGPGARILEELAGDLDSLQHDIEALLPPPDDVDFRSPDLPYSSHGKHALELAMSVSRSLSHGYVGGEHLLLGVIQGKQARSTPMLAERGATFERAREVLMRVLGEARANEPKQPDDIIAADIELRRRDGITVRQQCTTFGEAIEFLKRNGMR